MVYGARCTSLLIILCPVLYHIPDSFVKGCGRMRVVETQVFEQDIDGDGLIGEVEER